MTTPPADTATLDHESCYRALLAHDPRFDGAFFVGVATTGVYCRTVCPARTPRPENCTFHPSAAAAERAGFRPCLRCRPELAPGSARIDAVGRLAARAASRIEDGALTDAGVDDLAAEMGVSGRHLRRATLTAFGVTPVELAQTQRLLLATRLLTDTALPVTEVAFASGFSSVRRFNALFKERYRLNPSDLRRRRSTRSTAPTADRLTCEVAYRPPLDWTGMLRFLAGRTLTGVESVEGDCYRRTVAWQGRAGWINVFPAPGGKDALRVEVSGSLAPVLLPVLARVKRRFDLSAEPREIARCLGALAEARPGLRVPGAWDGFEAAARAVLGQQISVRAATTLAGRFARAFGEPVETPSPALTHRTPTAERVARADATEIIALGVVSARARTLIALARAVAEGSVTLEPGGDVEATTARLQELPGIGPWTAQYIALRALAWPDAFPHADLGVLKALNTTDPKRALQIAESWRPWRAYAVMHLWASLEESER